MDFKTITRVAIISKVAAEAVEDLAMQLDSPMDAEFVLQELEEAIKRLRLQLRIERGTVVKDVEDSDIPF
jgi:hypothetical protein